MVAYQDKILIDLLYPFYKEVQKANPTREVWLIEDNASAHQKAAKMCANMIKEKGIKKVDWPANSPDLHPIEDIWDQEKEMLSSKWKGLRGAGKGVQEQARKEVAKVWRSDEIFAEAQRICMGWKAKLELCRELKGKNYFRG